MKKVISILLSILLFTSLAMPAQALSPCKPRRLLPYDVPYSEADINTITNVVNGEVGGINGKVVLTYPDGSQLLTDGCTLHKIHAAVVSNQAQSDMFPDTITSCVNLYWSPSYARTDYQTSSQWQHCRRDVIEAFTGGINIPKNVFAATCDPYFAQTYPDFYLWARVDWDTGWVSGTFYYYAYDNGETIYG